MANAGAVVRSGTDVSRPSNEHSGSILELLSRLVWAGYRGAPSPVGVDPDDRERLRFVPGEVAIPPYPDWVQTDESLASIVALICGLRDVPSRSDAERGTQAGGDRRPAGV